MRKRKKNYLKLWYYYKIFNEEKKFKNIVIFQVNCMVECNNVKFYFLRI